MKLFNSNKKILSIDFGSSEIKIVEGQATKDTITISKNYILKTPQNIYENGKIINTINLSNDIKERLKSSKINNKLSSTAIINSTSIITREVNIPRLSEDEIQSIVDFQLSEFLPINPDDYVVNHLTIGTIETEGTEKLRILLVAIPKEMVISHLDLIKESTLKPEILDFQGNAIAKLLNFNTTINGTHPISGQTIAAIDLGNTNTSISIVQDGNIEVTRTIDIGASTLYNSLRNLFDFSLEEAEKKIKAIENINHINQEFDDYNRMLNLTRSSFETLIEKIESVTRYYTTRNSRNAIDLIVLHGGYSKIPGVADVFSENLNIESIRLQSLDKVKFDGDLSLYANAIGGLIRRDEVK